MGGDEDPVVGDVQQSLVGFHDDALARQVPTDVVAVFEDADPSGAVDPPSDCRGRLGRLELVVGIEDLGGTAAASSKRLMGGTSPIAWCSRSRL